MRKNSSTPFPQFFRVPMLKRSKRMRCTNSPTKLAVISNRSEICDCHHMTGIVTV
jgi:hypothetical protein